MKILFICTHNRCRSILAEAIANHFSEGQIEAASAGSEPAGAVHPMTLKALEFHNIPVAGLYSKSWEEMEDFEPDFVITVCDSAAHEPCPLWFGKSLRAHWNLKDPSTVVGSDPEKLAAYGETIALLTVRIRELVDLLDHYPCRTRVLNTLNFMAEA
jgi:arsenate reductase